MAVRNQVTNTWEYYSRNTLTRQDSGKTGGGGGGGGGGSGVVG